MAGQRLDPGARDTPSMRIAVEDPRLHTLVVLYPGTKRYPLQERVEAVPVTAVAEGLVGLFGRRPIPRVAGARRRGGSKRA